MRETAKCKAAMVKDTTRNKKIRSKTSRHTQTYVVQKINVFQKFLGLVILLKIVRYLGFTFI
jgi:predicted 2-oxoglutarate/Fe(II)-dependent dioxygenase YbiX